MIYFIHYSYLRGEYSYKVFSQEEVRNRKWNQLHSVQLAPPPSSFLPPGPIAGDEGEKAALLLVHSGLHKSILQIYKSSTVMIQSLYFSSECHTHTHTPAGRRVKGQTESADTKTITSAVKVSQTGSLRSQPGRGGGVSRQSV